jgi:hypothetical protein
MLVVEGKEAFEVDTVLFSREAGFQMVPIVVHWHIDAEGLDEEKNPKDAVARVARWMAERRVL